MIIFRKSSDAGKNFAPAQSLVITLTLLAFALRMFHVSDLLMWGDEGFSVFSASRDLLTITLDTTTIDPHPPLYYYLLHFYFQVAGRSELAIRFFSVCFGTALIPLAWVIAKRMFDARAGACAALLVAVAPFPVQYAQEVRMYALAMFLVSLGLYAFAKLNARETRARWIMYAAAMLLALFTLYHTALIFLAMGLVVLPQFNARRAFVVRWFAVSFGIVAAFIPWLAFRYVSAFTGIKDVAGDATPMDLPTFLARGFAAISAGTTLPTGLALQIAGGIAALIVSALIVGLVSRAANSEDALLVLLVVVPILGYYPLYLLMPLYRGRLFALACIPLMLLLARMLALSARRARWLAFAGAAILLGVLGYSTQNYFFVYNRYSAVVEDYLPLIREVETHAQPGDAVLFHAYWHEGYFLSHYAGAPLAYGALEDQKDLDAAVSQARNVWAIVLDLPRHDAEVWLTQNAFPLGESKYGKMRLLAYRAGTPARGETFASPLAFANGMELRGYHFNAAPVEAGRGIVTVQLDWQAPRAIAGDCNVNVRVTNASGDVTWAQTESPPASGTLPTSRWQAGQTVADRHTLRVPPGTPPGDYAIQIALADATGARVPSARGQLIALGAIQIAKPAGVSEPILPPNPANARWNEIALAGFASLPDEIGAGDALRVTLYWRAEQKPAHDYFAELKILDARGAVRAAVRYRPANGFATRAWNPGETWLDKVSVPVDAATLPGNAQILVGLVDEQGNALAPGAVEIGRVAITRAR